MKLTLLLLSLAIGMVAVAQDAKTFYTSKSGKLVYQFESNGASSEYTLLFDHYGKKQTMEFTTIADGVKERVKTIMTETEMFIVNYSDKTAIKFPITPDDTAAPGLESGGGINLSEMTKDVIADPHFKTGTETINGKLCDVYSLTDGVSKGKFWIWNNFLMKADYIDEEGNHGFFELKTIQTDMAIAASEFQPPAGFEITDMTETMQQMKMMQNMYGIPDEE